MLALTLPSIHFTASFLFINNFPLPTNCAIERLLLISLSSASLSLVKRAAVLITPLTLTLIDIWQLS